MKNRMQSDINKSSEVRPPLLAPKRLARRSFNYMKSPLNNSLLKTALLLVSLTLSIGSSKIAQAGRNDPPFVIEQYGTAPDGSILQWLRYTPAGTGPWPVVILVHGGGFRAGGPASNDVAAQDLQAAGFLALS